MADIEVSTNGPYGVHGLDLIRLRLHPASDPSEHAWVERESVDVGGAADESGTYWLCRCGQSADKPFCDGSHKRVGFDGTETASHVAHRDQATVMAGRGVVVRDVRGLCEHAGFCTLPDTNVWAMVRSQDPEVLAAVRVMVDHCLSGALTRAEDPGSAQDTEPVLPARVAVVDDGPYLVTGGVAIAAADGAEYERRNRVTLCRCGASANKPFCDGSHAEAGFRDS